MNALTPCSLIFILCLITISHSSLPANAWAHDHPYGHDLLKQICNETFKERIHCIRILRGDRKLLQARNIFEFSKAILELALKKGKEGQKFLKKLAKETKAEAIATCANEWHGGVVGSFRSALEELKESPETANYDAAVAADGPAYCETILAKAHIVNPNISALNHQMLLLSNIAFLATNKIPTYQI